MDSERSADSLAFFSAVHHNSIHENELAQLF